VEVELRAGVGLGIREPGAVELVFEALVVGEVTIPVTLGIGFVEFIFCVNIFSATF
jgi:hypothetical protein